MEYLLPKVCPEEPTEGIDQKTWHSCAKQRAYIEGLMFSIALLLCVAILFFVYCKDMEVDYPSKKVIVTALLVTLFFVVLAMVAWPPIAALAADVQFQRFRGNIPSIWNIPQSPTFQDYLRSKQRDWYRSDQPCS